jgi:hypothetical protein
MSVWYAKKDNILVFRLVSTSIYAISFEVAFTGDLNDKCLLFYEYLWMVIIGQEMIM